MNNRDIFTPSDVPVSVLEDPEDLFPLMSWENIFDKINEELMLFTWDGWLKGHE